MGLALATSACSELQSMMKGGEGSDGGTYMGGNTPVTSDPAGLATIGTGSTSVSGADQRSDFAAGVGLDQ